MNSPFNFYDFLGYLMPGAAALALVYWLLTGFLGLGVPLTLDSVGESIVFALAAYFAGHLVQILGKRIERRKLAEWGGWPSERLLDDADDFYTPQFKAELRGLAREVFRLSRADEQAPNYTRQLFYLCYALVMQEGHSGQTEIFNATYSLYRGMYVALRLGMVVAALVGLKHLALLAASLASLPVPGTVFFHYSDLHLALAALTLLVAVAALPRLARQWRRFSRHFANSVYRNFYVWCMRNGVGDFDAAVERALQRPSAAPPPRDT